MLPPALPVGFICIRSQLFRHGGFSLLLPSGMAPYLSGL
jgi:hypothetical protein